MTDLLHSNYIIDGVQMPLSPARMLRECSIEPPLEPDGDPGTLADEQLDLRPDNYIFDESAIEEYALMLDGKRVLPLSFAGPYTASKVAQALLDAIWMSGHFRLGDLTLKADWKWNDREIGHAAAFYHSVESACAYIDALGLKLDRYTLCSGQPAGAAKLPGHWFRKVRTGSSTSPSTPATTAWADRPWPRPWVRILPRHRR